MKYQLIALAVFLLSFQFNTQAENCPPEELVKETITFPSGDGLTITADTYVEESNTEFILLCHQAGYSRGEYIETAPKLVGFGYNCMAMDQRSGNSVNGVTNATAAAARAAGLSGEFNDAIPDIEAAIDIAFEMNGNKPIFLLGSSYSSSLSLIIGKDNPKVKATLAFSPGEYLSGTNVTDEISGYDKPVFVTSSRSEISGVTSLVSGIDAEFLTHFKPSVNGIHGSRSLWESTNGNQSYWDAVLEFLSASLTSTGDVQEMIFELYPNPTTGQFNIKTGALKEALSVTLTDLNGRIIESTRITPLQEDLQLVINGNDGLYFVKIQSNRQEAIYPILKKRN